MRPIFIAALFVALTAPMHAQASNPEDIQGHHIGESVTEFLRAEPEAQQEADVCRDRSTGSTCARLVAALDRGGRAEVSTSGGADFVLDGGRLVKVTVLIHGDSEEAAEKLTETFGPPAANKAIPSENAAGAKWENRLVAWSTPKIYATLYEDKNPSLQNREPVMVVETQGEHILEEADLALKTRELEANQLKH